MSLFTNSNKTEVQPINKDIQNNIAKVPIIITTIYNANLENIPYFILLIIKKITRNCGSILQNSQKLFAISKLIRTFATAIRDVAQPGRVRVWGACGRKFESCHPDYWKSAIYNLVSG